MSTHKKTWYPLATMLAHRLGLLPTCFTRSHFFAAFFLCMTATGPTGCTSNSNLKKVEAPAEGVHLRYDLSPGQHYLGKVHHSEAVDYRGEATLHRSVRFEIDLVVKGKDPQGGTLVTARFNHVNLNWTLPADSPISLSELTHSAKKALQGMLVDFRVDERGRIIHMPPIPADISQELKILIQRVIYALKTAFFEVPEGSIAVHDEWSADETHGRKGKLGRYIEETIQTKVTGFYQLPQNEEKVVKFTTREHKKETLTSKSGLHEIKRQGTGESLFSVEGGYLAQTKSNYQELDPGRSTIIGQVQIDWKKGAKDRVAAPKTQAPAVEVQRITDPCDPDYVGEELCSAE